MSKKNEVKTIFSPTGGRRFEHGIKIGDYVLMERGGVDVKLKVIGNGMAGMPELELPEGGTIMAFPSQLKPVGKE